jgi:hypothetical protein
MTRSHLAHLRGHDVLAHRPREMIAAERFTVCGQEHREVVGLDGQPWPRFADIFLKP